LVDLLSAFLNPPIFPIFKNGIIINVGNIKMNRREFLLGTMMPCMTFMAQCLGTGLFSKAFGFSSLKMTPSKDSQTPWREAMFYQKLDSMYQRST
jgi:hypothetical protein